MDGHHKHMHVFANAEITEMYVTMALRSFALSMIGIFIPLILLSNGYSFGQVLSYQIIIPLIIFLLFLFSETLMEKVGIKHTMLLSVPFLISFYLSIYFLDTFRLPVFVIAILAGLGSALYWFPFHIEFAKYSSGKKRGEQVGLLHAITMLVAVIGPFVGGLILDLGGTKIIMAATISIMIISGIPLILTKDQKTHIAIPMRQVVGGLTPKERFAFLCEGARSYAASLFWPLFMFYSSLSFLVIGTVYTVVRLVNVIVNYLIGKQIDRHNPKKFLKVGTIINALTLGVRGFIAATATTVTAITSIGGIGFMMLNTSFSKLWYDKASIGGPAFILKREFYLEIGRSGITFIGLILFLLTGNVIATCVAIMVIGALAALGMNVID